MKQKRRITIKKEGNRLLDPTLGPKKYWSIFNNFLGRNKLPTISPLFDNGEVITDYLNKAEIINGYFASQCTPLDEVDEIPTLQLKTHLRLSCVQVSAEKILGTIRALNPNKSGGWDGVSSHMLKICDSSIVNPIQVIFETCIHEAVFPEKWKISNVTPVHKKEAKNIKENYIIIIIIYCQCRL